MSEPIPDFDPENDLERAMVEGIDAAGEAVLQMIQGKEVSIPDLPLKVIVRESTQRKRA